MIERFFKFLRGQALVEVIISLAIVVILAIGLISTTLVTQKTSRSAKADTTATKLIQEYVEKIRIFRDRKGFASLPTSGSYYIADSNPAPESWSLTSGQEIKTLDNVAFTRSLVFSPGGKANRVLVTVTVSWPEAGGNTQSRSNAIYLSDCIQNSC